MKYCSNSECGYKHIETRIGEYLILHYRRAIEVGVGKNFRAAEILHNAGKLVLTMDVKGQPVPFGIPFRVDDIFLPDMHIYENADLIYAIRPAIEMIPPLIVVARAVNCDLIVYHLGFESFGDGGEIIDTGVLLHRYFQRQNPSNRVA
jgi:hypothetical protein